MIQDRPHGIDMTLDEVPTVTTADFRGSFEIDSNVLGLRGGWVVGPEIGFAKGFGCETYGELFVVKV